MSVDRTFSISLAERKEEKLSAVSIINCFLKFGWNLYSSQGTIYYTDVGDDDYFNYVEKRISVFDKGIITRHLKNGANLHQTAAIGENSKRRFFLRYGRGLLEAALFWLSRRPPADPSHSTRKV